MDIANIVAMFGAIATFLFGMSTMTDGLEKLSSGRLEHILERLTSNVFKGVLLHHHGRQYRHHRHRAVAAPG